MVELRRNATIIYMRLLLEIAWEPWSEGRSESRPEMGNIRTENGAIGAGFSGRAECGRARIRRWEIIPSPSRCALHEVRRRHSMLNVLTDGCILSRHYSERGSVAMGIVIKPYARRRLASLVAQQTGRVVVGSARVEGRWIVYSTYIFGHGPQDNAEMPDFLNEPRPGLRDVEVPPNLAPRSVPKAKSWMSKEVSIVSRARHPSAHRPEARSRHGGVRGSRRRLCHDRLAHAARRRSHFDIQTMGTRSGP